MANDNKISKFRFALIDDTSLQHLFEIRFSRTSLIVTTISAAVALCALVFLLIAFTPLRSLIPGYPDARSKRAAIQNAIKVDSLESVIFRWELYTANLKHILAGEEAVRMDSLINKVSKSSVSELNQTYLQKQDSVLRQTVNNEEQFGISSRNRRELPLEGLLFFTPVNGVILQGFNSHTHPFLDISAPAGSVIKAALDGTVVYAGCDKENGHIIYIQHGSDLITTYKNNGTLTKKVGDKIKAGTPIAVLGESADDSGTSHLHFELWHNGESIDPTKYLNL